MEQGNVPIGGRAAVNGLAQGAAATRGHLTLAPVVTEFWFEKHHHTTTIIRRLKNRTGTEPRGGCQTERRRL